MALKYNLTRWVLFPVIMLLILVLAAGCARPDRHENESSQSGEPENSDRPESAAALQDLAYQKGRPESDYTVMIRENGEDMPYLVLSGDYEGNCLLLRKCLLEDPGIYNDNVPQSAYYNGSAVDQFLEQEFPKQLEPALRDRLVPAGITITRRDSLYTGKPATETILRSVFLLSYTETNGRGSDMIGEEGRQLEYFRETPHRIAEYPSGKPGTWWLRTPHTWYDSLVFVITKEGSAGSVGTADPNGPLMYGIRPAFCLPGDTPAERTAGGYVLQ